MARARVICDNDYAGDPDGLVELAHHLLSPSVDVRAVLASHLAPGDAFDASGSSAAHGAEAARLIAALTGRGDVPVHAGAEEGLPVDGAPARLSPAAAAIVEEALRDDPRPLYVTCGGGLTEIATAWLAEPAIAERITAVVWIGGPEHDDLPGRDGDGPGAPPGWDGPEYNTAIDLRAAQVVFESDLPLWQVPRDAYRQLLVSSAELDVRLRPAGPLGAHLAAALDGARELMAGHGQDLGETYDLGDTPLVLLTALQSAFQPDTSSSSHVVVPAPRLGDDGRYVPRPDGRPIRVYTRLDVRLAIGDLFAKLERQAGDLRGAR